MQTDTLFLTLNIFSATGGIEKVCKVAGKALYEKSVQEGSRLMIWSMHDKANAADGNSYFPSELYKCYEAKKARFVRDAVRQGRKSKIVLLSHINLLMVGWAIKKMSPKTSIILMAHGIEIWGDISATKSRMIGAVDHIWAVSKYTRQRIIESHGLAAEKVAVLNNCLDPFLPEAKNISAPTELFERYGLAAHNKILFTLTRLSSREKYKGYNDVITAIATLNDPSIKYILAGKADETELQAVRKLIGAAELEGQVILAGFIPEEELAAHFKLSDCYIMPSSKEGFGIVFIEAMFYGIPVIGGNADGTTDALKDGMLGATVEPGNVEAISNAITNVLSNLEAHLPEHKMLMKYFSFGTYKEGMEQLLGKIDAD